MGESADSMVNGLLCEQCGVLIDGDEPGYPTLCAMRERRTACDRNGMERTSGGRMSVSVPSVFAAHATETEGVT